MSFFFLIYRYRVKTKTAEMTLPLAIAVGGFRSWISQVFNHLLSILMVQRIICQTECNFDVDPSSKCRPSATDNVFEELKGWLIRFFVIGRDFSRSIDNSTVF